MYEFVNTMHFMFKQSLEFYMYQYEFLNNVNSYYLLSAYLGFSEVFGYSVNVQDMQQFCTQKESDEFGIIRVNKNTMF